MCPIDPSPYGGEILREPESKKFPEREPGPVPHGEGPPDIAHRPTLPVHPEQMAVDIEDEEDDPVIDSGPGIADGP
ncbi:MAG: hypothetical protein ABI907_07410 [Ramlibacter sp.]